MEFRYTESAERELAELRSAQIKSLEKIIRERKYVPGDEFIEVTGSDLKDAKSSFRVVDTNKSLIRKLVPRFYIFIGICAIIYSFFGSRISEILFSDSKQAIAALIGVTMTALGFMASMVFRWRERLEEVEVESKSKDDDDERLFSILEQKRIFEKQHDLIHVARDAAVRCLPPVDSYSRLIPDHLPLGSQMPTIKEMEREFEQLLIILYDIFRSVIPEQNKIWVAIRDRRSDDCYHTWLRRGSFNRNRVNSSQPMHKDTHETVRQLKRHYDLQRQCVRITGIDDPDWEHHNNDRLSEDRSVMMGAVMTRSWKTSKDGGDWTNNCLTFIITVNSPDPKVFNSLHVPLLQSVIDSFSWLTNTAMRKQKEENKAEMATPRKPSD